MSKNKASSKVALHVRQDVGKGDPIVLVHGIFGDGTQWDKIVELLKKDFRVIVVDVLGHGKSPRPKGAKYTPKEHSSALRAALERIGVTQNITLVGYSMGGAVALSYAADYPKSIEQLYLISTPFYLRPDQMIKANYSSSVLFTKTSEALFRLLEHRLKKGKLVRRAVGYGNTSKFFHDMIGAHDNVLDADIIELNIKNMIHEFDFAGLLQKANVPTTFYAGKKDLFIVQGQVYALKEFSPYMEIRRLDVIKVDHMLVQNLPKEITGLITKNKERLLHVPTDTGSGKVLVLLHGIESSANYWQHLVPALSEKRRVVAIDLLGYGKSPKPKNIAYSLNDQVAWLHRTLQSLGIKKAAFAGHSLGSLVALAYAATYPRDVDSLTLFSPVLLPKRTASGRFALRLSQLFHFTPKTKYLYAQAAQYLGEAKLSQYMPSARSLQNAVHKQDAVQLARLAKNVPTTFVYGTSDPLVDEKYVKTITKIFKKSLLKPQHGKGHNFVIFSPKTTLEILDNNTAHKHVPKKTSIVPMSFTQHIARLAIPTLIAKSAAYISVGLLLFSSLAPATLVVGLSCYIVFQGYRTIKGAFSLKNEGLSYIAYILLGLVAFAIGYALFNRPQASLKIAVLVVCGSVLVYGIMRAIVGIFWASSPRLKRSLLLSGTIMILAGIAAFAGSLYSIYLIVYALALYIISKGFVVGWYAAAAFAIAYIRGFDHRSSVY